jgi:hypothetical protein
MPLQSLTLGSKLYRTFLIDRNYEISELSSVSTHALAVSLKKRILFQVIQEGIDFKKSIVFILKFSGCSTFTT